MATEINQFAGIQNNIELCSILNGDPGKLAEVIKSLKERLRCNDWSLQLQALTLLESMSIYCGLNVHRSIAKENIPWQIVTLVRRQQVSVQVRDKALELISVWKEKFGGPSSQFPEFLTAFIELRNAGFDIPQKSQLPAAYNPSVNLASSNSGTPAVSYARTTFTGQPQYPQNIQPLNMRKEAPVVMATRQLSSEQTEMRLKSIREVVKKYHKELQSTQNWRLKKLAECEEAEQEIREEAMDRYSRNVDLLNSLFSHDTEFTLQQNMAASASGDVSDKLSAGKYCRYIASKPSDLRSSKLELSPKNGEEFDGQGNLGEGGPVQSKGKRKWGNVEKVQVSSFDSLMAKVPKRIGGFEELKEFGKLYEREMGQSIESLLWASPLEFLEGSGEDSGEEEVSEWTPVELRAGFRKVFVAGRGLSGLGIRSDLVLKQL